MQAAAPPCPIHSVPNWQHHHSGHPCGSVSAAGFKAHEPRSATVLPSWRRCDAVCPATSSVVLDPMCRTCLVVTFTARAASLSPASSLIPQHGPVPSAITTVTQA
ncbi:hypothetical protein M0R45_019649 [Rubus argutus]|uniref:Uncharacterized protein n=1 Tax=Rubus argutus TaxID=59490 RepID=A0AAW1X7K1_RUBAR